MSARTRTILLVFVGGVLLFGLGVAVALWHGVAIILAIVAAMFVMLVVVEGVRQQLGYAKSSPVFDPQAEARAVFANIDRDERAASRHARADAPAAAPPVPPPATP